MENPLDKKMRWFFWGGIQREIVFSYLFLHLGTLKVYCTQALAKSIQNRFTLLLGTINHNSVL
ncbi:hypothetical protein E2320_008682 [Naja naja]|nr:hypothetical protein E2320_008682 [Naja naja]